MKKFENVTLLVNEDKGEMKIIMDKQEFFPRETKCLENEFLCSVELNNGDKK
jgi:hypothetical protein